MYTRKRTSRFVSVFIFLIFCLLLFSFKLTLIQIFRAEHLADLAAKQHNHSIVLEPIRGTIYDRRQRPLALNMTVYSLFANPRAMKKSDKTRAVKEISTILGLKEIYVKERLARDKLFVWLMRKLPKDLADQIKSKKLKGMDFMKESKRYYPNKQLAAHIIGFAGVDNRGLDGLELQFDQLLKGKEGWCQYLRDARQNDLLLEKSYTPPQHGFNLVLTIDETIQYIAEQALEEAYLKNKALSATLIIMDPRTGEILALANQPTYDLERFGDSKPEERTNRGVVYVYEPGSVFKIVAASAALEEGLFTETDSIFCENGEYRVGNHILHDHHPLGKLSFKEVIEQSSNIGTTKIAQKIGPEKFYKYAKRFHFGEKTGIDLGGEVTGVLPPPSAWSKTTIGAIPIGHEVLVTPIQLVSAISAIANDGVYMKPFIVKQVKDNQDEIIEEFHPQVVDQVISAETARRVKDILVGVVENGTGKKAKIEGVAVAGKTGTAQKVVGGNYSHNKFFASFIGFAPAENPRVAAVVVFDEPHPDYYGGTVAAPVFQKVIADTLKYLQAVEREEK